jgi:ABC-type glycerol-3-phosphate transport system substrate-binding protein
MGAFIAERIGVGFQSVPYTEVTTYQTTIRQALQTKSPPDMFTWWSGYRVKDLVERGLLADVTAPWKTHMAAGEYDQSMAGAFTFSGKIYALPFFSAYWAMLYNKKVFQSMKLEEPQTWDDLMKTAETLKKGGVTPFAVQIKDRWPSFIWFEEMLIRTNPPLYEGVVEQKVGYSDPQVVKALQPWKEMIKKGWFPSDLLQDYPSMFRDFAAGKYGMTLLGDQFVTNAKSVGMAPDKDLDVFVVPNINPSVGRVIILELGPWCIPQNVLDPEPAMKIADFWLSPEAQSQWARTYNVSPLNKKASVFEETLAPKFKKLGVIGGNYRYINRFWEATPVPIAEYAVDKLGEFMIKPDRLESILEDIDKFRARQRS